MKDLIVAKTVRPVRVTPSWEESLSVPAGELVLAVRAENLSSSTIYWWLHPLPGFEEEDWHDYAEVPYGVGAGEDDLEIVLDIRNELHRRGVEVYS